MSSNLIKNVGGKRKEKIALILVTNSENLLMKLKFGCNYRTFVYKITPKENKVRRLRLLVTQAIT